MPACSDVQTAVGPNHGPNRIVVEVLKFSMSHQISTSDRTHARTGPETPQAEAQSHTQNSNTRTHTRQTDLTLTHTHLAIGERCQSTDDTAHPHAHTPSATTARERERLGDHRLRELHRPLGQRIRPPRPLPLHLPLPASRPTSSSWRLVRPAYTTIETRPFRTFASVNRREPVRIWCEYANTRRLRPLRQSHTTSDEISACEYGANV